MFVQPKFSQHTCLWDEVITGIVCLGLGLYWSHAKAAFWTILLLFLCVYGLGMTYRYAQGPNFESFMEFAKRVCFWHNFLIGFSCLGLGVYWGGAGVIFWIATLGLIVYGGSLIYRYLDYQKYLKRF